MRCDRFLVLIGFRAVGKSTIAAVLAERTGIPCVSTDAIVEEQAGMAIAEIVQQYGWQRFRELERQTLLQAFAGEPKIIDAGGGIVEHQQILPQLVAKSWMVWLTLPLEQLKIRNRMAKRPAILPIAGDNEVELLWQRRKPLYESIAHFQVDCSRKTPEQIAEIIIQAAANKKILR